jgi:uncharacterized protein
MKKVTIPTTNQQKLIGTLFYPDVIAEKNPAVMFIPGWTSEEKSYHQRAQAIVNLGYMCLTISLRGHGESDGNREDFSRADHLEDVLSSYDFFASQTSVDPNHISLVGASYGGYLASVAAGKRRINTLVLRAPAFYYNKNFTMPTAELVGKRETEFFQNLHLEKDNLALSGVKKVTTQLLVVESEHDQIIPHTIIELYLSSIENEAKKMHTLIHYADHQLSKEEWKQTFIDILKDWFQK